MVHAAYPVIFGMNWIAEGFERFAKTTAEVDDVARRHAVQAQPRLLRLDDGVVVAAIGDVDEIAPLGMTRTYMPSRSAIL